MKIFEHWVSILASIGTLVSAIVALVTLKALKRQTNSSYKPEVFLSFNASNKVKISNWKSIDKEINLLHGYEQTITYGLIYSIENVGFGVSKNVTVTNRFDYQKAAQEISKHLPDDYEVSIMKHVIAIYHQSSPNPIFSILIDNIETTEYDFILPRKDEKFDRSPFISPHIIALHVIYFLFKKRAMELTNDFELIAESFKEFPSISTELSYKDIGENKFSKNFTVDIFMNIFNPDHTIDLRSQDEILINLSCSFHMI